MVAQDTLILGFGAELVPTVLLSAASRSKGGSSAGTRSVVSMAMWQVFDWSTAVGTVESRSPAWEGLEAGAGRLNWLKRAQVGVRKTFFSPKDKEQKMGLLGVRPWRQPWSRMYCGNYGGEQMRRGDNQ